MTALRSNKRDKERAIRLAKELRPGKQIIVTENPRAPDADERTNLREKRAELEAQKLTLSAALNLIPKTVRNAETLQAAAEFVVAVDADDPSLPQLRDAVEARRAYLKLQEEYNDISRTQRNLQSVHNRRFELAEYDNTCGLPMSLQIASGDTWAEVCEKINQELTKKKK